MRVIRYRDQERGEILAVVTSENQVYDLPFDDFFDLVNDAKAKNGSIMDLVQTLINDSLPLQDSMEHLELLVPINAKEVWAAGVTYLKSKEARNYEATSGKLDATTFYDKVYDADRPEIFLKSTNYRTIGTNGDVFLRTDSNWQIPEPELGLVIDNEGNILAYTVGNDMSCRDIEGENPLYLPQAKIWKNSCAIGPALLLAETVEDPYQFEIKCRIFRKDMLEFEGSAKVNQLKRKLTELVSYLTRDNVIFDGTVLLTGTCIVPPNDFTLQNGDQIEIEIPGIGILTNFVKSQVKQPATF